MAKRNHFYNYLRKEISTINTHTKINRHFLIVISTSSCIQLKKHIASPRFTRLKREKILPTKLRQIRRLEY
jgi:hypothetical protein